jgi:SAM-dependent methyltransferase
MSAATIEPGSFRDPHSRVVEADGAVLRLLSEQGLRDWDALSASELFPRAVAEGKLVGTEVEPDGMANLPDALVAGSAAVLRHEVVPFVSYPYEWTFAMLKDAALLQLELLRSALDEDLILKDSSPYNVQWRGAEPVFIDVGSFEALREGEPWVGYRQFCMLFLYPLLLQAYKGIPFQPWLRGRLDGIEPQACRDLMSFRDLFRSGVLSHVVLHARLERSQADSDRDVKRELGNAGFKKELIVANVKRLERLVRKLEWRPGASEWSDYGPRGHYTDADSGAKDDFVRRAAAERAWELVWDLGCNDGRFSRIAAEHARTVVAMDADAAVVDRLYRSLREEGQTSILPLFVDLVDPSPALGWRGSERRTLSERGSPALTLCLALIHHVAISGNVPVRDFLEWLRSLETKLVIEFPTTDDPLVKRLLARKQEGTHPDYERGYFERCLGELFDVGSSEELSSGTRVLYVAQPKA